MECNLKLLVRKSNVIYTYRQLTPKAKVAPPEAMRSSISSPPSPQPGARCWLKPTASGSNPCVHTGSLWANPWQWSDAPPLLLRSEHLLLQAGPRSPGAPYLQALRGRLPHLPAAGSGRGDAGETLSMAPGGEGLGGEGLRCRFTSGVGVRGMCVRGPATAAGWALGGCKREEAARRSAAGNLWARPRAGCPGAAARRLRSSARAHERTAAAAAAAAAATAAPSSSPAAAARTCAL